MPLTVYRPDGILFYMKQKDISFTTKIAILDAASRVILAKGAEALTLESAAREAGISKGGLLYHFSTKSKLIAGMIERLISGVEETLEKELQASGGDFLEAYIRISFMENPEHNKITSALFAAIANDPDLIKPLRARYRVWQDQAAAAAPSPEVGTIIRLALDGLWISDLLDFAPPSPEIREKMLQFLLSITRKNN
jgi:AcrR family transcriptional regulator